MPVFIQIQSGMLRYEGAKCMHKFTVQREEIATRLGYSILCLIVMQVRLCAIDPKSHSELNPKLIL